jgi:hypothetical protein
MNTPRDVPNPNRPRLNTEMEIVLEPADRRSAAAYNAAEAVVADLLALADSGAVMVVMDASKSTMHRIETIVSEAHLEDDVTLPDLNSE